MAAKIDPGGAVLEKTQDTTKEPALYKVVLHNDDYTTMEFVIEILEMVFHKLPAEAFRIMMQVHTQGSGICGLYTYEVAETKAETVHDLTAQAGFPLKASVEAD